jgi:cystathionine beta-synthase
MSIAYQKHKEIKDSYIPNQYCNPSNALVHYDETAEEILQQLEGNLDYLVMGAGTGGTLMGIGRKFKSRLPHVKIIGVDPEGSILAYPEDLNKGFKPYKVEGIGGDFIPKNCDRDKVIDQWVKVADKDAFLMARRIMKEEGLLTGGSCGAILTAALQVAKTLDSSQRMLVMFPDGARNYMSKILNEDWLLDNKYISLSEYMECWQKQHLQQQDQKYNSTAIAKLNLKQVTPIGPNYMIRTVIEEMKRQGVHCLPVIGNNQNLMGIVSTVSLTKALAKHKITKEEAIEKVVQAEFRLLQSSDEMEVLIKSLDYHNFVIVQDGSKYQVCEHQDLLNYLVN